MSVFPPPLNNSAKGLALALLGAGAAGVLAINLPGHLSYDSVVQLAEGRAGAYSGFHPPVMSWLLGLADALVPGAVVFVVLDVALIFGGLIALVGVAPRAASLAPVAAGLALFAPQLLIYPAIVWKDVLFAGAMVAGFAALACAGAGWPRLKRRISWLAVSVGLLCLAALSRQNGALVLPIAALAVGAIAARTGSRRRHAWGAGYLIAGAALTLAANAALATRLDGTPALSLAWENLQIGDIVGATARQPQLELAVLEAEAPGLRSLLRGAGVAALRPDRLDSLDQVERQVESDDRSRAIVFAQWRRLVAAHPWLYLQIRADAFRWVFATPDPGKCVMVVTGVDGAADDMAGAGLAPRKDARDKVLAAYAHAFAATPLSRHATYAAAALALLAWLLSRRTPTDLAVAAMLASALAFAASFFVISIACDYRYLYALDLATIAAGLYAAASPGRGAAPAA